MNRRLWCPRTQVSWGLVLLCSIVACAAPSIQLEDVKNRWGREDVVAILPPLASSTQISLWDGNEILPADQERAEKCLPPALREALLGSGPMLRVLDWADLAERDLGSATDQLLRTFAEVSGQLGPRYQIHAEQPALIRASLGPQAAAIASDLGVDLLVLSAAAEFHESDAMVLRQLVLFLAFAAAGQITPLPQPKGSVLGVMVVDGRTGEIVWSNASTPAWKSFEDDSNLSDLVSSTLKPFLALLGQPDPAPRSEVLGDRQNCAPRAHD